MYWIQKQLCKYTKACNTLICELIVALGCHLATSIYVNTGSCNGLLPDGTKPLPEPVLTYHQ